MSVVISLVTDEIISDSTIESQTRCQKTGMWVKQSAWWTGSVENEPICQTH